MFLNDPIFSYIQTAMDIAKLRQSVIASNIANADTPNYKARYVPFKDVFSNINKDIKLKITNDRQIRSQDTINDLVRFSKKLYLERNDKNDVKIDRQLYLLSKNTIFYNTLVEFERYKIKQYQNVISASSNL